MPLKRVPGPEDTSDRVYDSQDSDADGVIVRHELLENATDFCVEEGDTDDDLDAKHIFGDNQALRSKLWISETDVNVSTGSNKFASVVEMKQYDLGRHFDPKITTSLDKLSSLNKLVVESPKISKVKKENNSFDSIRSSFKRRGVSPHYSDLISNESISKKFIDWHFITEDSQFKELSIESTLYNEKKALLRRYPTIESLLMAYGVSGDTLDLLETESHLLTSRREIDTLCQISPIESMLESIACYVDKSEHFAKYFVCFILDRKIYESISCDSTWCTRIFMKLPQEDFYQEYFSLVHRHDYFLHHRTIKLITGIQTPLIRRIFFQNEDLSGEEATKVLVTEFNNLFDKRRLRDLLYFILSIYGSQFMPFGDSSATQYFKNCVDDLFNASASDVEFSLLSGVLGVYMKMRE